MFSLASRVAAISCLLIWVRELEGGYDLRQGGRGDLHAMTAAWPTWPVNKEQENSLSPVDT